MTPTTTADAAFTEQVLEEWRDWRAYLQAQQTLITARQQNADDPFELSSSDLEEAQAEQTLNRLPPARRGLFQQEHERRREQVARDLDAERRANGMRGAADPDEVDARTLALLRDECDGRGTDDGRGLVPRADETYWGLDVADLLDAPAAGAYALKGSVTTRQKVLLVGAMGALVVGVVAVFWLLLFRGGGEPVAGAEELLVNGQQAAPIALAAVRVGGADAPRLPLTPVPPPTPFPPDDAQAAARTDAVYPPLICLDAAVLEAAQEVTLVGEAQQPERRYTLRPPGEQAGADLLLRPCDGRGEPRAGTLQQVTPPTDHPVGETVTLTRPDGSTLAVTVPSITLVGPGHDLTLPADGARVLVTARADQPVDWPTLTPMLLLQTGAQVLPAETQPLEAGGVQFRFLIDVPPTTLDLAFVLQSSGTVARWRTTREPPPPHLTVLRRGLRVSDVQAVPGELDSGLVPLTISATLENTLEVPLALTPADVAVTQEGRPLPLPDLPELREPLAAGAQRELTLLVEVTPDPAPLTLTLGAQRSTLTVTLPAPEAEEQDGSSDDGERER